MYEKNPFNYNDDDMKKNHAATAEPPLTVSSINSSFTLHFVQSQRSHEDAEKFCADHFPGGKLVSLDSPDKRTKTGDLAIKVL